MYAAVHIDDIGHLQRIPEEWDKLNIIGSFMYWYIVDLENTSLDPSIQYIELTKYQAMGWKFYQNNRGYLTFYEGSNLPEQLDKSKIVIHLKKRKDGVIIENPIRYKYELSEEDFDMGRAFGEVMEPYVQRTIESQA